MSHHRTKFGVHRHCSIGDIMLLVFHVKTKFGGHRHCVSGDIIVHICHMTLQDHMIKALFDFMV